MSFQISISPKDRAAGRFVTKVRRAIQKALAEEFQKRGVTQSDLARSIGVNRSVISRELRGHQDMTLSRVAEFAWALDRMPNFEMLAPNSVAGSNISATTSKPPIEKSNSPQTATTKERVLVDSY